MDVKYIDKIESDSTVDAVYLMCPMHLLKLNEGIEAIKDCYGFDEDVLVKGSSRCGYGYDDVLVSTGDSITSTFRVK